MNRIILLASVLLFQAGIASAQRTLTFQLVSPKAKAEQYVGSFAHAKVVYHRPAVKGREVLGNLIPIGMQENRFAGGKPMPWRAGANDITTLMFSHDVKIGGKALAAGKYGLHIIGGEEAFTLIFSHDTDSWGSYFYNEENDALRVEAQVAEASEFREWLEFGFNNLTGTSMDFFMHWGNVAFSIPVVFDIHEVNLSEYDKELTSLPGFNPAAWNGAANYCLSNDFQLERGLAYAERAIAMNPTNFSFKATKAQLLGLMDKAEEADFFITDFLKDASDQELYRYANSVLEQGRTERAIELHEMNVKSNKKSWIALNGLGMALDKQGDKKNARKNLERALKYAPENQKVRIEKVLQDIK